MDARDAGTVTILYGLMGGIKLQIGPIGLGAFFNPGGGGHGSFAEELGWRHGELGEVSTTEFVPGFGFDESGTIKDRTYLRGKEYTQTIAEARENPTPPVLRKPHNYTRLGFALGLGGGVRFEINPGEWIDFVLGIVGIDIYGDDIYSNKPRFVDEKKR